MEKKRLLYSFALLFAFWAQATQAFSIPSELLMTNQIEEGGQIWVVLVAGSSGYFNYRHQADVCHAYQIVSSHGIPDENIIVMMYDDIAENKENPKKGMLFNKPLPKGQDVYHGVPKDYTGKEVSNQTFVDVLHGKKLNFGSGKTLKSGPRDHVFVFFSDHGAKGLVAFPETILHATSFVDALKTMHSNNQFAKMTIYIEACESGSMFKGLLPENINIYATTASNATTSSYACYYDDTLKTFLGDVYSVKWMEDSDKEDLNKETLEEQYKIVKRETNTSMVCQFGDMSISKMKVADFQGEVTEDIITFDSKWDMFKHKYLTKKAKEIPPSLHNCGRDAVPSPEVPRIILEKRLKAATSDEERDEISAQLKNLIDQRRFLEQQTKSIIDHVTQDEAMTQKILQSALELTQFDCHRGVVEAFHDKCFNLGCNGFALRQINHFATMCELGFEQKDILTGINKVCSSNERICGIH